MTGAELAEIQGRSERYLGLADRMTDGKLPGLSREATSLAIGLSASLTAADVPDLIDEVRRLAAALLESRTNPIAMEHYSAALDHIYRLRFACAYEAHVTCNLTTYATLPKVVLQRMNEQIDRLHAAAGGAVDTTYASVGSSETQAVLRAAGAPETLTRAGWEATR